MSKMDDLFDDSPFTEQEEPAESDPPASLDVKQEDVSFGFPPTGAEAMPEAENSAPLKYSHAQDDDDDDDDGDRPAASEPTTPHDDIKVSVKSYEATADDFIFNVEVSFCMSTLKL